MNLLHAVVFGIVEGITEFLPISSTGHLILTARALGLAQTGFLKSFEIAIQLGAILAVLALYWKRLLVDREVLKRVLAAFFPTAVLGFIFYPFVKKFLLGNTAVVLWSLLIGGVVLIVFERWHEEKETVKEDLSKMTYGQAMLIGLFQSIAIIPGVSRSAATIVGGLLLGFKRKTIVEFSFLLAVPTMLAATALDLIKHRALFSSSQTGFFLTGFAAAFVVALFSVKFLLYYIKNHSFIIFGVYRILAAFIFFFWLVY